MNRVFILLFVMIFISACGFKAKNEKSSININTISISHLLESDWEKISFPFSVTDFLNRTVEFKNPARRIISLTPAITEILYSVGAESAILAVTEYCNYPERVSLKPKVGGYSAESISIERILSFNPDTVLCGGAYHNAIISAMEKSGITIVSLDPYSINDIYNAIIFSGIISLHPAEAKKRVEYMARLENKISSAVAEIKTEKPNIYWEIWNEPLMSIGNLSIESWLLQKSGGSNLFTDVNDNYMVISSEEVLLRNPDIIILPRMGADRTIDFFKRPGWASIRALETNSVFVLDGDILTRPGPRIINAMGLLFKTIHPDVFMQTFGNQDPLTW